MIRMLYTLPYTAGGTANSTSSGSAHIYAEPDELMAVTDGPAVISDHNQPHHQQQQQQQLQLDPANITIDAILQRGMSSRARPIW